MDSNSIENSFHRFFFHSLFSFQTPLIDMHCVCIPNKTMFAFARNILSLHFKLSGFWLIFIYFIAFWFEFRNCNANISVCLFHWTCSALVWVCVFNSVLWILWKWIKMLQYVEIGRHLIDNKPLFSINAQIYILFLLSIWYTIKCFMLNDIKVQAIIRWFKSSYLL